MEKHGDDDHDQVFNKYYLLRRTLLIILSLSVLSLLYFPRVTTIFPYNSLTHALERKYVFLVCNGILAFLVKTSAISRDDSTTVSDESLVRDSEETCVQGGQEEEEEVEYSEANKYSGSEIKESGMSTTPQEEEELMSTEELNRKVEEFIRKMKEEIRVEAQEPLITV